MGFGVGSPSVFPERSLHIIFGLPISKFSGSHLAVQDRQEEWILPKDWNEMTTEEKIDLLAKKIETLGHSKLGADFAERQLSEIRRTVDKLEARVKALEKAPGEK